MSLKRAWGVFLRYFFIVTRLDQIADLFYWPIIDIFLWGMTSVWMQKQEEGVPALALFVLTGLIFWQIVWRANYEVGVNLLQEFWNRNLVNLFSTPLKLREWILGATFLCFFKILVSLAFGALIVFLLYEMNVFMMGWAFLPFAALLTFSGWMIGFLAGSIVIYWGQRFQMLVWMMPYLFAPFSAVFYPVSVLPAWGQSIAWALPTTYIFEGMRKILTEGIFPTSYFFMSLTLNILYLVVAVGIFKYMFEKSRVKGLGRLE